MSPGQGARQNCVMRFPEAFASHDLYSVENGFHQALRLPAVGPFAIDRNNPSILDQFANILATNALEFCTRVLS